MLWLMSPACVKKTKGRRVTIAVKRSCCELKKAMVILNSGNLTIVFICCRVRVEETHLWMLRSHDTAKRKRL